MLWIKRWINQARLLKWFFRENPENPIESDKAESVVKFIPVVGLQIAPGSDLSCDEEYFEPSSEDEPVVENEPVENEPVVFGYDEDYIGDPAYVLCTGSGIHLRQGCRTFVRKRRTHAGFLVPQLPVPERFSTTVRPQYGDRYH